VHDVAPAVSWNLPAPQLLQLEEPRASAYVPAPQAEQAEAPVDDVRPTGHEAHVVALRPEYSPLLHLLHEASPVPE